MNAELKEFYSLDFDLNSYWPEQPDNFGFWVRAMIGPKNGIGSESFDIQICTPEWLKCKNEKETIIFGYHMLIVSEYDLDKIKEKISKALYGFQGLLLQMCGKPLISMATLKLPVIPADTVLSAQKQAIFKWHN